MKTVAGKRLALVVLVGGFILIWRANTDSDVAMAQARKAVVITRIFTGPDGLAHAEDIELTLNARGVPLKPSDLIRNFVFLYAARRGEDVNGLYDAYWREFDEAPDDARGNPTKRWWRFDQRQGRLDHRRGDASLRPRPDRRRARVRRRPTTLRSAYGSVLRACRPCSV